MPLSMEDFPSEMQSAFFMLSFLSDRWEGMSGQYLGKDWGLIPTLFDIYKVDNPQTMLLLMKQYEIALVEYRAKKAEQKHKKQQATSGGKNFTHKVQG